MPKKYRLAGIIAYMVASLGLIVSVFLPYIRYKFRYLKLMEYKISYNMKDIADLRNEFYGLENVGIMVKLSPYLMIMAGTWGIVMGIFILTELNYTYHIHEAFAFATPILATLSMFFARHDKVMDDIWEFLKTMEKNMHDQNYVGSAGYGIGHFLLIIFILITAVGSVFCFILDDEE